MLFSEETPETSLELPRFYGGGEIMSKFATTLRVILGRPITPLMAPARSYNKLPLHGNRNETGVSSEKSM